MENRTVSVQELVKVIEQDGVIFDHWKRVARAFGLSPSKLASLELGWNTQSLPGHELITEIISFWLSSPKPLKPYTVGDLVDILKQEMFRNRADILEREYGRLTVIIREIKEGILFNVQEPANLFTGREEELKKLHKAVHRNSEGSITVVSHTTSVSGLGGIGKTELVRKYASKHEQDYDGNIIWINAETKETLKDSFIDLARDSKVKVPTKDRDGNDISIQSIVKDVYRFFENRLVLFIFDNADPKEDLKAFLPSSLTTKGSNKPYVLITSRDREWERGVEVIEINELTLQDAMAFVKKGLGVHDKSQDSEIEALVNKLQRFPLAIQQAISCIENEIIERDYGALDYVNEFDNKAQELLDYGEFLGITNFYGQTTFTTWKITIDKIRKNKDRHGMLAIKILEVIAYLAPENINREILFGLEGNKEEEVRSAVRLLVKYSMVKGQQKQSVLSIHRLVQEVTRLEIKGKHEHEETLKAAFEILKENYPYSCIKLEDYGKKRQFLPHLEAVLSHMEGWGTEHPLNLPHILTLLSTLIIMGEGYSDQGNPARTVELLQRALRIQENHYGPNQLEVTITLTNLGNSYGSLGDHNKKKKLLKRALIIIDKHYGPDHFEVAKILTNLGNAYGSLGDYKKQKVLHERDLIIMEKHYGPDHFEVAATLVNLGNAYGSLGDPKKQINFQERALIILEKHYGQNDYQVAATLTNLGNAHGSLGEHEKKKEFLERAFIIKDKYYGPDHFEVAPTLVNLGNAYGSLGDPKKQINLQERALIIHEKHYGPDHFEIAKTLVNLGNAYGSLGDHEKKKEFLERALIIKENYYGSDHFEVARTLVNLGNAYGALGDYEKKKEFLERALIIEENYYGPDHFEVAITLGNLGNAYGSLGDHKKKKEFLERVQIILSF